MKNQATGRIQYIIAAILIITLLNTAFLFRASAQAADSLAGYPVNKDASVKASNGLGVAMYQIGNSLKFSVNFENYSGKDVTVSIIDNEGRSIYQEITRNIPKYIRRFDLNKLSDGRYIFMVSSKEEAYTEEVDIQTYTSRKVAIHEQAKNVFVARKTPGHPGTSAPFTSKGSIRVP